MRDILFRGKCRGKWVYGSYVAIGGLDLIIEDEPSFIWEEPTIHVFSHRCDKKTVCQYTGLKDKNGKKIFEGDILRQCADTLGTGENAYFYYKLFFDEKKAKFGGFDLHSNEIYYFEDLEGSEVIGNIFDLELLKEEEFGN